MDQQASSNQPRASLETLRLVDEACDRYEALCREGPAPDLAPHLQAVPEGARDALRAELEAIRDAYRAATEDPGEGKTVAYKRTKRSTSGGLQIRCPHCENALELLADAPLEEITCDACGSNFSLVDQGDDERSMRPLQRIGRFDLVSRLGLGGFGSVWKAYDAELDRVVAVKIPRRGQLLPHEMELFFREARAAAQLAHPHIVPVHEVGRDGETIFIVSELIRGEPLSDRIKGRKHSPRETAELLAVVADALDYAHERGVVHRDLKPSNVMIDDGGRPYLMDFGLAKRETGEITMTVEGQVLGTPAYMSPEQAGGQVKWVDRRSDVYSLGVMLFQMLSGELPFRGTAQSQIQQRLVDEAPNLRRLDLRAPLDLATLTAKCMEREQSRRYATAREVADELRRYLRGEPIHARPLSPLARAGRWSRRNPALAGVAALTAVLAVAGPTAAVVINSQRAEIARQLAARDRTIVGFEEELDRSGAESARLRARLDAILAADPGAERELAGWRETLIEDFLDRRYDSLSQKYSDESLAPAERAEGNRALADLLVALNQASRAAPHLKAAAKAWEQMAVAGQGGAETRVALAATLYELAAIERDAGELKLAQAHYEKALALRNGLAAEAPESLELGIDRFESLLTARAQGLADSSAVRLEASDEQRKRVERLLDEPGADLQDAASLLLERR
ncbi:Serine/threonine-protein kinase PrkC [Pseudobythopirellula maris]|uniref:non-specific serine/threonine protein kinase n=1 Tax=Pseudobythopirellula maris TaxID=2527991 RepID=A0A5C5ZIA8_9BACT|nr:serine/threonine-protein kinase [Pseudobythopirellula maris]TWT86541.1 Serine/threonine-protein kinase PrkC [Pseudobythopirellula maris]